MASNNTKYSEEMREVTASHALEPENQRLALQKRWE